MTGLVDNPIFSALAVIFTILFVACLRSFIKILPSLFVCIGRWKGNIEIEDSLQLSRSRDLIAWIIFIPCCMVAYSFGLYTPEAISNLSPILQFSAYAAVAVVYIIVRIFLNWQLEAHNYRNKTFIAANKSFRTYLIILFMLMFICGPIIKSLTHDAELTKSVLTWVMAVSYIVYVIRRGQIFASACNPFATILYLCGLEILPTAALVLSAKLL